MLNVIGKGNYLDYSRLDFDNNKNLVIIESSRITEVGILDSNNVSAFLSNIEYIYSDIFKKLKPQIAQMMNDKAGVILFLFNPQLYKNLHDIFAPIQTQSMYSLMLSLSKELSAFGIIVFGVVKALNSENDKHKKFIRDNKMDIITLKYKPFTTSQQMEMISRLLNNADIFRGQMISLGSPLTIYR